MPGLGIFEFLSAGRVQLLGTSEICACTPYQAKPEKNEGSMRQRPRLPHRLVRPAEIMQGATEILMGLAETAHVPQYVSTPHEHAAGHTAVRAVYRPVQDGQTLLAPTRPCKRHPQACLHIDFTFASA